MTNQLTRVDAANRSLRSMLQGLFWDVLIAIAAFLLIWLPDADISSKDAWLVMATALAKTVLTAAAAYVMRAKLDGSAIPTPLPPTDPSNDAGSDAEAGSGESR